MDLDLLVIGSGPGGQRAAIQAAKLGKRVGVIERRNRIGGVSIHSGTIPSKTLRQAILEDLAGRGADLPDPLHPERQEHAAVTMLHDRVGRVVASETAVVREQFRRNNVGLLTGDAQFVDPHTIRITDRDEDGGEMVVTAENVVIAVGTSPARPSGVDFDDRRVIDSDGVMELDYSYCKTMTIVGGGVIGVEYTCMFAALGVRVTLIEKRPRLLEFADQEIIEALSYHLRDSRVTMRLGEEVDSVEELPDGTVVANLQSKKKVSGDALLYAVGRQGAVDELNLAAAGLEADNRGRIPVDEHFQTSVPHIFAVGDVVGFPSLASVSMEQGRIAAARAFNDNAAHSNPSFYPYGIYTIPEISFIGKTEEQLTDEDVPYEVGMAYYRETARGQIRGDTTGRLKLVFHRDTRKVLGVHIIGEGAAELVHIGQAVMILGGTVDYFIDTVFNYPTLAECYKAAAFNGIGRLNRYQTG